MGVGYHRVGIAGSGRVARAMARALAPRSAKPVHLWGRSPDRVRDAARAVGAVAVETIEALAAGCDLIVIAVADAALAPVAVQIAAAWATGHESFVCHMSGGSGAAVLAPLHDRGALVAAVHPAMTFTGDAAREAERMAGARFAITAPNAEALAEARALVGLLGGVAVEIAEERRALYHAALSHAANHLVTLFDGASHALRAAGADDPGALLAPLVRAALENSLAQGFAALSGPLLRGDRDTVIRHLAALETHSPQVLPAYRAMALATLHAIERDGGPPQPDLRRDLGG